MKITTSLFAATIVTGLCNSARAEFVAENWKGYNLTPEQKRSIKDAQNQDGADCCGDADGMPVEFDIKGDHYVAFWDGDWRPIPANRLVKHMKVEFPLIWLTAGHKQVQDPESGDFVDQGYRDVRCFWPGAGG